MGTKIEMADRQEKDELGHNLGMSHDHDKEVHNGDGDGLDGERTGCEHQDHVMSYDHVSPCIWSDCSLIDFIDHYYTRITPQNWCMPELTKKEADDACMGKRELVSNIRGKRELVDEELSSTSSIEEQLAWLLEEF